MKITNESGLAVKEDKTIPKAVQAKGKEKIGDQWQWKEVQRNPTKQGNKLLADAIKACPSPSSSINRGISSPNQFTALQETTGTVALNPESEEIEAHHEKDALNHSAHDLSSGHAVNPTLTSTSCSLSIKGPILDLVEHVSQGDITRQATGEIFSNPKGTDTVQTEERIVIDLSPLEEDGKEQHLTTSVSANGAKTPEADRTNDTKPVEKEVPNSVAPIVQQGFRTGKQCSNSFSTKPKKKGKKPTIITGNQEVITPLEDNFPHAVVNYLPPGPSDHAALCLQPSPPIPAGPRPFRYFEMWEDHPQLALVVEEAWKQTVFGSPLFQMVKRLSNVKAALKVWNQTVFGNLKHQLHAMRELLESAQKILHEDPFNMVFIMAEANARTQEEEGGLGIKNLADWNTGSQGVRFWDLVSNRSSLWSTWVKLRYLRRTDIWNHSPPQNSSGSWKQIIKSRRWIIGSVRYITFEGKYINIWKDPWLNGRSLTTAIGRELFLWGPPKSTTLSVLIQNEKWVKPNRWSSALDTLWEEIQNIEGKIYLSGRKVVQVFLLTKKRGRLKDPRPQNPPGLVGYGTLLNPGDTVSVPGNSSSITSNVRKVASKRTGAKPAMSPLCISCGKLRSPSSAVFILKGPSKSGWQRGNRMHDDLDHRSLYVEFLSGLAPLEGDGKSQD
ncbi:hypothetical protein QJS10_CPA07g00808 [Acorus calamus]|uniref:Uncharacterized protein n=1 Tax=Acorus calamus TaxID=4465 RepID=A0AAV9EIA5_ACOCL|nr:hypothetical protein QJS10_CPA07g00808 [Acorus calamus]